MEMPNSMCVKTSGRTKKSNTADAVVHYFLPNKDVDDYLKANYRSFKEE